MLLSTRPSLNDSTPCFTYIRILKSKISVYEKFKISSEDRVIWVDYLRVKREFLQLIDVLLLFYHYYE